MEIITLQDLILSLEDVINCPVCLERLGESSVQCINGHSFCRLCTSHFKECPTCGQALLSHKPTLLIQILEKLPKLCKYNDKGCKEVSFSGDHEPYCVYRHFKCTLDNCTWESGVWGFKRHLETKHCDKLHKYSLDQEKTVWYPDFGGKDSSWRTFHVVDNNLFMFVAAKDNATKRFLQWVKFIPKGRPKHKYYYAVAFSKDCNIIFKHTNKAEVGESNELDINSPYCMILPLEELYCLVDSNGSLKLSVKVTQTDVSNKNIY